MTSEVMDLPFAAQKILSTKRRSMKRTDALEV
jgi:hypothetical protein